MGWQKKEAVQDRPVKEGLPRGRVFQLLPPACLHGHICKAGRRTGRRRSPTLPTAPTSLVGLHTCWPQGWTQQSLDCRREQGASGPVAGRPHGEGAQTLRP